MFRDERDERTVNECKIVYYILGINYSFFPTNIQKADAISILNILILIIFYKEVYLYLLKRKSIFNILMK